MKNIRTSHTQFGLIAWLEQTRVSLPLKGVECRFDVTGTVASVELDQIYHQDADRPLDCTYTFPLPAGAAVYRCELHINGRVIRAKVEARQEARRIYEEQKAAGRRAALVETERENLFTLSLGNVQPGDLIVVRFAWFQVLDRAGDSLRLLVPMCPGVRYIPGVPILRDPSGRGVADDTSQVPDASRISPPRIDALHPDAAYVSMQGRLSASEVASGSVSSPSHPVCVRENEVVTVDLAHGGHVPDRDFVLAWSEQKALEMVSRAWHWADEETYALVQFRAPEEAPVAGELSQDFYFLVDRSGSMQGAKWTRTCEALRAFVALLGERDRVWITLFESAFRDFAEAPLPAPAVLADGGFQGMERLGTAGGTELLPAAEHVLAQIAHHSKERGANITDGQVGNEAEILRRFQSARHVRVHTFGIDTAVNDAFLKNLARRHRGGCRLQTPADDIAGTIASLAGRLCRPVLTDLSVLPPWEPGDTLCPDLHAREVVTLALRGGNGSPVGITGRLADGAEHRFTIAADAAGSEAIKLLWARERITRLLAADQREEAIAVAKKYNIVCEGAAFVAWDESEQVLVASEEIVQPAMQPCVLHASTPRGGKKCSPVNAASLRQFGSFLDEEPASLKDDAELIRENIDAARKLFAKLGIPNARVDALFDSVKGREHVRLKRAKGLFEAADAIREIRQNFPSPLLREAAELDIRKALNGSIDELLKWKETSPWLDIKTIIMRKNLYEAGMPEPLVDYFILWVVESGAVNRQRLSKIEHFLKSLGHLPFSDISRARCWRELFDETLGSDSEAYANASKSLRARETTKVL